MVLIYKFRYFKLLVCVSFTSLRCSVAIVDVLKRMRSKVFSAGQSVWLFMVWFIISLILVMNSGSEYRVFLTFG